VEEDQARRLLNDLDRFRLELRDAHVDDAMLNVTEPTDH